MSEYGSPPAATMQPPLHWHQAAAPPPFPLVPTPPSQFPMPPPPPLASPGFLPVSPSPSDSPIHWYSPTAAATVACGEPSPAAAGQQGRMNSTASASGAALILAACISHVASTDAPTADDVRHLSDSELLHCMQWCGGFMKACEQAVAERLLCGICFDRRRCVVFMPCKHEVACKECADQVHHCPMCRAPIAERVVPYR
eukprot:GGOE01043368.1.p1 GENE.GGOE01043368.1~~GGOE01043368.1.p1  ORF type:complete len:199 (-),score=34.80 GGOE01043368.1:217-813(-)